MPNKLKPCPFCGGEAQLDKNEFGHVNASCKDHKCRGWACCLNYNNKKEAVDAWNRRAGDAVADEKD